MLAYLLLATDELQHVMSSPQLSSPSFQARSMAQDLAEPSRNASARSPLQADRWLENSSGRAAVLNSDGPLRHSVGSGLRSKNRAHVPKLRLGCACMPLSKANGQCKDVTDMYDALSSIAAGKEGGKGGQSATHQAQPEAVLQGWPNLRGPFRGSN